MPYIPNERRIPLLTSGVAPVAFKMESPGELNYTISAIINEYLHKRVNYSRINEVIGVLECAKMELYRRIAAPYEDKKIEENGDVYTCQK